MQFTCTEISLSINAINEQLRRKLEEANNKMKKKKKEKSSTQFTFAK